MSDTITDMPIHPKIAAVKYVGWLLAPGGEPQARKIASVLLPPHLDPAVFLVL